MSCAAFRFLYDVALGDVVETNADYEVTRVHQPSGRLVYRVWFGDHPHPRGQVAAELAELGALLEWSSTNLLAVDAADESLAAIVGEYLAESEAAGRFAYETGKS